MAHYFVPVILPFGTPDNTESKLSALETLMNPHEGEEWDWYNVGGRWEGVILGKSVCDFCYNGVEEQEQIANNCTVANLLIKQLEQEIDQKNTVIPHFLVTPDGQWLCNDSDRDMYLSVLSEYPDCFVVGVDVHN